MRLKKGEEWFEAYDWIQLPKNVPEDNNPVTSLSAHKKAKKSTAATFIKSKKKLGNK